MSQRLGIACDPRVSVSSGTEDICELPDGKRVDLGLERWRIPEQLFGPIAGLGNFLGLQRMVADAIINSDLDIRKELYSNIIVGGGNSLIPGLLDRLQKAVGDISPQVAKARIYALMPPERKFSAWIGGSLLSSLGSFQQMWVSKQEYDHEGPTVIERKCA